MLKVSYFAFKVDELYLHDLWEECYPWKNSACGAAVRHTAGDTLWALTLGAALDLTQGWPRVSQCITLCVLCQHMVWTAPTAGP